MKTFSQSINESNIVLPEFVHHDLKNPRDEDGMFWKAIEALNNAETSSTRNSFDRAEKQAKDLYQTLLSCGNDKEIEDARKCVGDLINIIRKSATDTPEELSASDAKMLKIYLFIIQKIDSWACTKKWYNQAKLDVKAGYVALRGAAKDPKIKYRIVLTCSEPVSESAAKELNRSIRNLSPLHMDYVAGIEWNKDRTKLQILLSKSPGYHR